MKTCALLLFAVAAIVPDCACAQVTLAGTYSGNMTLLTSAGTRPFGLTLAISSVDGNAVKGTATTTSKACNGIFPMVGRLDGDKLTMHVDKKDGAAGFCEILLKLSVEGNKLVGTNGSGGAVELSK